jgi:hypothetical protein
MQIKQLIFPTLFVLLVVGCSSTKQFVHFPEQYKIVEDASKGRIYVLRTDPLRRGCPSNVWDDGKIVGTLNGQGFLCWEREPGTAVISSKTENASTLNVNVEAGKVYYIFQSISFGFINVRNKLVIISEHEGRLYLTGICKRPETIK